MRVHVKLFATLARHRLGLRSGTPFEIDLPEGAAVADLLMRIGVPTEETKVIFVNGRARSLDSLLVSGDQVGLFPPIGGG